MTDRDFYHLVADLVRRRAGEGVWRTYTELCFALDGGTISYDLSVIAPRDCAHRAEFSKLYA